MKEMFFPILVVGMPQSGSTLLYNIILNILKISDFHQILCRPLATLGGEMTTCVTLVQRIPYLFKGHHRNLNGEILLQNKDTKVFTTRRDIRDCVASNLRKRKKQGTYFDAEYGKEMQAWLKEQEKWDYNSFERAWRLHFIKSITNDNLHAYQSWEDRTNCEFVYESYKNGHTKNRIAIVLKIAKTLNLELNKMDAKKILHFVEEVLAPASLKAPGTCEETFMGPHIITNNGIIGGYKDTLFSDEIEAIEEIAGDWLREYGYMK